MRTCLFEFDVEGEAVGPSAIILDAAYLYYPLVFF